MFRRYGWLSLMGMLFLGMGLLNGCNGVQGDNPKSAEEQSVGGVKESADQKTSVYVAKQGDTLPKIAARNDIYGDRSLWPLIAQANADVVHGISVQPGTKLLIPRDKSPDEMEAAREQARQAAAKAKANRAAAKPAAGMPAAVAEVPGKGKAPAQAGAKEPEANAVPTAEEVAAATPMPAPVPVKPAKSGMTPVLLVILLILLIAALVLLYFMRKEKKD